jgi:hypothetical protein
MSRAEETSNKATVGVMGRSAAGWLRAGLLLYCGAAVLVGGWAAGWPRSFYDDFPWPGHPWVAPLGAYNEHLLRDFGGMNLAMAVVFGVAAASLDRRLATTALVAYLVFAVPHLVFHLNHLEPFGTLDAVAQVAALVAQVVLALLLLTLVARAQRSHQAQPPPSRRQSA